MDLTLPRRLEEGQLVVAARDEEFWPALFDAMPKAWVTDQSLWPKGRTLEMFHEWFEIQAFDTVEDLYEHEAIDDLD